MRDIAYDSAVDGLLWAIKHHDEARGPFSAFARRITKQAVARALANRRRGDRNRPDVMPLDGEDGGYDPPASHLPSAGEVPMSAELRDLPPLLRDTVRLHLIDGYSLEDVGLLTGCCAATARLRLHEAAKELAPGRPLRARPKGSKRLRRTPGRG